jgi:hypothetical protein
MNAAAPTTWQVPDLYTLLVGLLALQQPRSLPSSVRAARRSKTANVP